MPLRKRALVCSRNRLCCCGIWSHGRSQSAMVFLITPLPSSFCLVLTFPAGQERREKVACGRIWRCSCFPVAGRTAFAGRHLTFTFNRPLKLTRTLSHTHLHSLLGEGRGGSGRPPAQRFSYNKKWRQLVRRFGREFRISWSGICSGSSDEEGIEEKNTAFCFFLVGFGDTPQQTTEGYRSDAARHTRQTGVSGFNMIMIQHLMNINPRVQHSFIHRQQYGW
ncbi:hypothetical protein LZ30DRAFT_359193 [Colletotrichum cereale]|nr:hypothetical protein LZ30DRAFT_359193 [Colletotrichum cereale]